MAKHACESCHGPSPEHNNARPPKGEKRPPVDVVVQRRVRFSRWISAVRSAPPATRAESTSTGQAASIRRTTLPAPIATSAMWPRTRCLSKKTEAEVCFTCHAEQRSESFQFSHHPVREGKVGCSDCHNTHGSGGQSLLKEFTVNEVCYTCHAEQRGPFLWEHQPVREDCSSCHKPHGSTQSALLTIRSPFLCQTCHQNSRAGHEGLVSGRQSASRRRQPGAVQHAFGPRLSELPHEGSRLQRTLRRHADTLKASLPTELSSQTYQGPKYLTDGDADAVGRSKAKRQPTSTRLLVGCRFALDRPTCRKYFTDKSLRISELLNLPNNSNDVLRHHIGRG